VLTMMAFVSEVIVTFLQEILFKMTGKLVESK